MNGRNKIVGENVKRLRLNARESWADLAKAIGVRSPNTISAIERGGGSKHLPQIAAHYKVSITDLDPSVQIEEPARIIPAYQLTTLNEDVPVFASVEGGEGALVIHSEPIDMVSRPQSLAKIRNAYGILVTGNSMEPVARPRETVLVNPMLSAEPGDLCVFRHESHGQFSAKIKEYIGRTERVWKVREYQPRKRDFELERKIWRECHVVVWVKKR